jgi:hypothetical protein
LIIGNSTLRVLIIQDYDYKIIDNSEVNKVSKKNKKYHASVGAFEYPSHNEGNGMASPMHVEGAMGVVSPRHPHRDFFFGGPGGTTKKRLFEHFF